jgi:hypothetical protein
MGGILTPETAGKALVQLRRADTGTLAPGYLLTGEGLQPMR